MDLRRPIGGKTIQTRFPFLCATDFLDLMGRVTFGYFLMDVFLHFIFAVDIKGLILSGRGPRCLSSEAKAFAKGLLIRSPACPVRPAGNAAWGFLAFSRFAAFAAIQMGSNSSIQLLRQPSSSPSSTCMMHPVPQREVIARTYVRSWFFLVCDPVPSSHANTCRCDFHAEDVLLLLIDVMLFTLEAIATGGGAKGK